MNLVINLFPSASTTALISAIQQAEEQNRVLVLQPGVHLTSAGYHQLVPIGANGLHIRGTGLLNSGEYSIIRRPDHSIDPAHSDDNYGLFFVPAAPSEQEWAAAGEWIAGDGFDYRILIRGSIIIENILLDCNMGKQGLDPNIADASIEHSAMLAFSGQAFTNAVYPGKKIFVGFRDVALDHFDTINGGFADDIWISRGDFRPNILNFKASSIRSSDRINRRRATLSFSGLAENIAISDAVIFQLHAEDTGESWNQLPAVAPVSSYSHWTLSNVTCDTLELAAKGQAILLDAANLQTTFNTSFYQTGGKVSDSVFHLAPQATMLNRLNRMEFDRVSWFFVPFQDDRGYFTGLAFRAQYGEGCFATFNSNNFQVAGDPINNTQTKGLFLIETEYSTTEADNQVHLEFAGCTFDSRFGQLPHSFVARVDERGDYLFSALLLETHIHPRQLFIRAGASIRDTLLSLQIDIT